jgi:hypothetical protein
MSKHIVGYYEIEITSKRGREIAGHYYNHKKKFGTTFSGKIAEKELLLKFWDRVKHNE